MGVIPGALLAYIVVQMLVHLELVQPKNDIRGLVVMIFTFIGYYFLLGRLATKAIIFKLGFNRWPEYEKYFKNNI